MLPQTPGQCTLPQHPRAGRVAPPSTSLDTECAGAGVAEGPHRVCLLCGSRNLKSSFTSMQQVQEDQEFQAISLCGEKLNRCLPKSQFCSETVMGPTQGLSREPYQASPFTGCRSGQSGQVSQTETSGHQGISPCTELVSGRSSQKQWSPPQSSQGDGDGGGEDRGRWFSPTPQTFCPIQASGTFYSGYPL